MNNRNLNNTPEMMAAFQEGDQNIFAEVYEHFFERLYFFACRFVQESEAKDVTADAFIKLWDKRKTFRSLESVSKFLFTIVRNRCFDLLKHEGVKNQKHAEILSNLNDTDETDLTVERIKEELMNLIYAEVDRLPPKMKEIFLLSFSEGLKPAQIAERLQINVQTVSNQKLSAIRLLKTALGSRSYLVSMIMLVFSGR